MVQHMGDLLAGLQGVPGLWQRQAAAGEAGAAPAPPWRHRLLELWRQPPCPQARRANPGQGCRWARRPCRQLQNRQRQEPAAPVGCS